MREAVSVKAFEGMLKYLLSLVLVFATGCTQVAPPKETRAGPATGAPADRQVFEVRGVVQEVLPEEKEVVIKHEEIPDYMPAMTMHFEVKNTNELAGLNPNDQVAFSMIVTDDDGWIENVRKVGVSAEASGPNVRPHTRLVRDVEPLEPGDKMPDYTFTNSLGKTLSLSELKGKAYAFTFIFTRCPFPTFCPRMNNNFAKAYQDLINDPNLPSNWHLISISFDPEYDTPERLRQYSQALYKPNPQKWSWVTGAMMDIDAISEQVGLVYAFENNTINHNLRTVVVDRNGVIRQIFIGNEWTPEELTRELIAGAKGKAPGEY